ncbi:MAG: helix-turn-helix domain-containing protein [Deltaproteobacteria bacterium]|jgi:predicted DNA-binding transcriptional regulator AlpA|nr:helix-turn-helix domain-containing protein [Deltaproteobacteria bacterium]
MEKYDSAEKIAKAKNNKREPEEAAHAPDDERFLATDEVSRMLSLSSRSINRMFKTGDFPRPLVIGAGRRKFRFLMSEVTAWMRSRPRADV